ncbi:sensor histidine kinase [Lacrimispora sp. JR3]|uniref:sensor histidine kinase n=1 Tax=Lacrimispora sinapis TaxID=3111456 RepID=UPI003749A685
MVVIVTYLTMNILRTYVVYDFIQTFLKKRRAPVWAIGTAYVIYYLVGAYLYFNLFSPTLNIVFNLTICFLISLFYKTSVFKRILASSFLYILSLASEDCMAAVLVLFIGTSFKTIIQRDCFVIIGIIFSNLLMFGLVKWSKVFFKTQETYHTDVQPPRWLAIFLIPAGSIYILNSLTLEIISNQSESSFLLTTAVLVLLVINILLFHLYDKLLLEENLKYENLLLSQQNDAYEKQSVLVQQFQKSMREKRHNLHNHLAAISGLAEQGQKEELMEYIKKLTDNVRAQESGINSGQPIIDALINNKLYLAQHFQIKAQVHIRLPEVLKINKMDLTIILGNLLDNAMEACMKLPKEEREILIDISELHGVLTIQVINTYDASKLCIKDGRPCSTKKDKTCHGIGLNSVDHTIAKYNGVLEYDYGKQQDGEKNLFTVNVLLYLPDEAC